MTTSGSGASTTTSSESWIQKTGQIKFYQPPTPKASPYGFLEDKRTRLHLVRGSQRQQHDAVRSQNGNVRRVSLPQPQCQSAAGHRHRPSRADLVHGVHERQHRRAGSGRRSSNDDELAVVANVSLRGGPCAPPREPLFRLKAEAGGSRSRGRSTGRATGVCSRHVQDCSRAGTAARHSRDPPHSLPARTRGRSR